MEGNAIPVSENKTVIVKCSGDLFLRGEEQAEVRFQSSEDRIRVQQSNENVYVETHASMDISVPRRATLIIERVGGSAFLQDLDGSLTVLKVGGDLALQRLGSVRIEKAGGSCLIEDVRDALSIGKIGGDLTVRQAAGAFSAGTIGGSASLQLAGIGHAEARVGGDTQIYLTQNVGDKISLKSGGDIDLYLPENANAAFNLQANGERIVIRLRRQGEQVIEQDFEMRRYEILLGGGDGKVEVVAGGDIRLSDEEKQPDPISDELGRREMAWKEARERHGHPSWSGGFGFDRSSAWADMISRRAQEAARRAEQRAQGAVRRTEEQIRQAAERELRRAEWQWRSGGGPMPPTPPPPPSPAHPVTEKERLMILQMLQDGKITVEQAEMLLAAMEGRG